MDNNASPGDNGRKDSGHSENIRVLDAEIVDNNDSREQNNRAWNGRRYRIDRTFPASGGAIFWSDSGCLASMTSIFIFFLCLGQWGMLAAIGFFFFHTIGSIAGTFRASRYLMVGYPYNPWPWRCGNWIASFLLTCWLAGGFAQ